jgi:hypothetical protein
MILRALTQLERRRWNGRHTEVTHYETARTWLHASAPHLQCTVAYEGLVIDL